MRHLHVFEAVASYKRNERKGKRRGSALTLDSAPNPLILCGIERV